MRRVAIFIACMILVAFTLADQASARRGGFGGGGFRGGGFRGGGFRGGGFRGGAFGGGMRGWRGGRGVAWRGGRRGRGRGWGFWPGLGIAAAVPYYYGSYYDCPLVRRRVWTPYGYRLRWVRSCHSSSW